MSQKTGGSVKPEPKSCEQKAFAVSMCEVASERKHNAHVEPLASRHGRINAAGDFALPRLLVFLNYPWGEIDYEGFVFPIRATRERA